jgi:hypothetical protein
MSLVLTPIDVRLETKHLGKLGLNTSKPSIVSRGYILRVQVLFNRIIITGKTRRKGMSLNLEILVFVRQKGNIINKFAIPSIFPARANEEHEVGSKHWSLARNDARPKLIPQKIHHIKLKTGVTVLVSEIQKVSKISINLINADNLGIKDISVNAKKDVINWAKKLLRAIHHFSFKIEISKKSLINGLESVVSSKESFLIVRKH